MNLNLTIIKDYLPSEYHTRLYGPAQDKLVCPRPLLYAPYSGLTAHKLYMFPDIIPETLSPDPDCSFIFVGNQVPASWAKSGASILQIRNFPDFYQVFNTISDIFNFFDQWENTLRNELEKQADFDIKEIIKAGTALFQNDISVTDHTHQVILRGRSETDRSGHTRISVIDEPHSIGLEYTERIKNVCHLERNITVPYISSMENSSIRSYCYNLYPQGHFTGCVSITELLHPFRDSDFVLADFYFSYFHKAFEKYLQSFHAAEQISVTVIRKLLDKLPMTAEEKKAIALKKDEKYICFKLQERIETHFMPMDYMHALLCTFFPDQIFTVIRHEQIIGFMKISSSVSSPDPLFLFQDLLEKMNYTAGLSNYFTDLSMIHNFFMQAEYVIHHFPGNKNADTLRYFENNVLSYMLSQCVSDMPIEALTDSSLKRVMEYDRKKHTEYLYTLEIYLKNETSITRTSEELFIHRSSLIKRINKLKKLLQKDLEDPKLRLYYRIWFSLYRISTIS